MRKMTFALCFCNRGFMPGELIYGAWEDMVKAVTDVFTQYQMPFTVLKPHVVHPLSEKFAENLRDFAAVCRVVNGMKRCNIGCIGARTTASKTVRFDEIAMQKYGINVESFDLSELNDRGITASCEIDMCSAVTMRAMALASETPTMRRNTQQ